MRAPLTSWQSSVQPEEYQTVTPVTRRSRIVQPATPGGSNYVQNLAAGKYATPAQPPWQKQVKS